eukprot:m.1075816 g.1075816  ORF g.1075816 m.1075816 type:complete len:73 (-) comp24245_c0_seq2:1720-1938(-)
MSLGAGRFTVTWHCRSGARDGGPYVVSDAESSEYPWLHPDVSRRDAEVPCDARWSYEGFPWLLGNAFADNDE